MSVQLDGLNLPQSGQLDIDIRLSATINITAFAARQKVTGYLADEISTNMHGGSPTLSVGERITWHVPVILSLPPHSDMGGVGHIDVDVETGQMMVTQALIQEIQHRAEALAAHPTPKINSPSASPSVISRLPGSSSTTATPSSVTSTPQ